MADLATRIIDRHSELSSERASEESRWRKLVRYVLPQEAAAWGVDPCGPRSSPTVDDTARECLDNLVASLDEMLYRRQPYQVVPKEDSVAETGGYPVEWADYATHNLSSALDHPRCGFTVARQLLLRSTAGLGFGCMYVTERPGKHLVFRTYPAAEVAIAENADGIVDTVFRSYEMTIRQVVEMWGQRASERVRSRLDRSPGEKVRIIHAVYPRYEVMPSAHKAGMPWASVYLEADNKNILDEGGFHEFPFAVPRWDRGCSPYGWSPGMTVLDEILRVNAMGRSNLMAGQRIADPETYIPNGMFQNVLVRRPGATHYYDTKNIQNAEVRQWPTPTQLPVTMEMAQAVQVMIREAFFYYLLQPPQSPNMTATEWIGRQRQMARRMGAPVGRHEQEAADPTGSRAFALLVRAGAIQPPEPPWHISDFEVRFISPLGQMKQLAQVESIQHTLSGAAMAAQFDPSAARVIDAEEVIREQHDALGAPTRMLRNRRVVQQMREDDAQRQQIAEAGQVAMTGATVGKLAAQAQQAAAPQVVSGV